MRSLKKPARVWMTVLFLSCFLAMSTDAKAAADPLWPDAGDVYQYLSWEFSVPVKLKGMMNECKKLFIKIKVYDAAGAIIGEAGDMIDLLGEPGASEPNFETVRVIGVNPAVGKNPFTAKRYTVDMTFDNGEIPSFNNPKIHYRAKDGSELVYHIEEDMPEMAAAGAENVGGGVGVLQ